MLAGRWWPAYSGIWIIPPLINPPPPQKKKKKKKIVLSDKTFWIRACISRLLAGILLYPNLKQNDSVSNQWKHWSDVAFSTVYNLGPPFSYRP